MMNQRSLSPAPRRATAPPLLALLTALAMLHAACSSRDEDASPEGASGAGNQASAGQGDSAGHAQAGASGQAGHAAGAAGFAGSGGKAGAGLSGSGGTGAAGQGGAGLSGSAGAAGMGGAGAAGPGAAGSAAGQGGAAGTGGGTGIPPGQVKGLVAVGYGGLRVASRDQGATWGSRSFSTAGGGDDLDLLRAVVWGNGLWVSTGWKLFTSPDGVTWQDHGKLRENGGPDIMPCNIVEGLAFHEGYFYALCDGVMRSSDGLKWEKFGPLPELGGHQFLTHRAGQFVVYGDNLASYSSTDALSWVPMEGVSQATYCDGAFRDRDQCQDASWFDGVWLRAEWGGKITRSTDGTTFSVAYQDDQSNTPYQSRAIAEGYVAP